MFQEILYGISTGFGSPQVNYIIKAFETVTEMLVRNILYEIAKDSLICNLSKFQVPVAEILARAAPSPPTLAKPKSSNFLQVPDLEGPRYDHNVSRNCEMNKA